MEQLKVFRQEWPRSLAGLLIIVTVFVFVPDRRNAEAVASAIPTPLPALTPAPVPDWPELSFEVTGVQLQITARQPAVAEVNFDPRPIPATQEAWSFPLPAPAATPVAVQLLPVEGQVTQGFGCSPYYTGVAGPGCPDDRPWFHDGVDIATAVGSPVKAGISGSVIFAGPAGSGPECGDYRGYGLAVVVDSGDGWQALYAHLAKISVTPGQWAGPDTVIGYVGNTGCVTGAHLHFGLRHNGDLVDPQDFVFE